MSLTHQALSGLGKLAVVIAIAVAFIVGLTGTVYLSLRSSEVKVPDVIGKDRLAAENALSDAGLNIRVRATRPVSDAKPDTVVLQLPHAGEVVKAGQTVAVDLSRAAKEGESAISAGNIDNKPEANKPVEKGNANEASSTSSSANKNENENLNKPKRNKNTNNKNANNSNANNANNSNSNNSSLNRNLNGGNANNRNANANRTLNNNRNVNANANTRNANLNVNRNSNNLNRRAPTLTTPPFVNPGNRRTP